MKSLKLETRQDISNVNAGAAESLMTTGNGGTLMITPPIDEEYWLFRVPVSAKQAVVAFPKFCTLGIGFQVEEQDWNTNLPYTCEAEEIANHIKENAQVAGDDETPEFNTVVRAIMLLQDACHENQGTTPEQTRELHRTR